MVLPTTTQMGWLTMVGNTGNPVAPSASRMTFQFLDHGELQKVPESSRRTGDTGTE